jgi:DNA-binding response OmpR family regulator
MRILVVEDDPMTLELTKRVIEHMGHSVLPASDADEGLALAETEGPDAFVVDLHLPGKPGWLVIGELRSDERFRTTPIIAVSAGTAEDRDRAMTAGATAFFRKPYEPAALRAALEEFATT